MKITIKNSKTKKKIGWIELDVMGDNPHPMLTKLMERAYLETDVNTDSLEAAIPMSLVFPRSKHFVLMETPHIEGGE